MPDGIFLIKQDKELIELTSTPYDSENLLQDLLAKYPSILAGKQIDAQSPRRWLLISREMGIPSEDNGNKRWSIDHLFLDQDGIPTLVEVKRSNDTRIRREVIGQMLEYAANAIIYWPIEEIITRFESRCESCDLDPEEELSNFIQNELNHEDFWGKVKVNLQAGKIRMIFVADNIPIELQRIIEFLNSQMDPAEVIGVEVEQYVGEGLKTLVPRVLGQTAEARQKKGTSRKVRQWDETTFFEEITNRCISEAVTVAKRLLKWASKNANDVWWGKGSQSGSFVPTIFIPEGNRYIFAIYTYGKIEIYFQWLQGYPPFNQEKYRIDLLQKLNALDGINLPNDSITRRPSIPLEKLFDESNFQEFTEILNWVIEEFKK